MGKLDFSGRENTFEKRGFGRKKKRKGGLPTLIAKGGWSEMKGKERLLRSRWGGKRGGGEGNDTTPSAHVKGKNGKKNIDGRGESTFSLSLHWKEKKKTP